MSLSDRETLLCALAVGDIFHAEYSNGAVCIGLVLAVDDAHIQAKRIASQENLEFDRRTGVQKTGDDEPFAVIKSTEPLPADVHNVFLELDRKYAAVHGQKDIFERNPKYFKLTDAEKKALLFIHSHYVSNPLPPLTEAGKLS